MKTMKKVLGLTVAMVLVLSMGMSVFAAPSVGTTGVVSNQVVSATDKDGVSHKIIIEDQHLDEHDEHVEELKEDGFVEKLLGDSYVDGMKIMDVCEVRIEGDKDAVKFPLKITFKVPGVTKNTKVVVLHYCTEKNTGWEKLETVAGDGTVTATFNSLSPVAFVIDQNTINATSPKDGEMNLVPVIAVIALVAAAGAVVLRKRATR